MQLPLTLINSFFDRFPFTRDDLSSDIDVISDNESEISDNYSDAEQEEENEEEKDINSSQFTSSTDSNSGSSSTAISFENEYSTDEELSDDESDISQMKGGVLDEEVYNLLLNNLQVLRQTRNLVVFIKNHRVTKDYLKKQIINNQLLKNQALNNQVLNNQVLKNQPSKKKPSGELIIDMKIRWCSTYNMLKRFLDYKIVVQPMVAAPERFRNSLNKKQQTKLRKLAFNDDEWNLLDTLAKILEPFRDATEMLSGQYYPTLGLAYYVSKGLENFLLIQNEDSELTCAVKKSVQAQFTYYFDTKVSKDQHQLTLVCCLLNSFI